MKHYQTIQDHSGKDLFVLVPVAEFEALTGADKYGFQYDDETESDLVEIEIEQQDNENALIPFDVVKLKQAHHVNLLGAWRIYRNLSQQEVAEQTGLTQSAISQMERKESKPQKKTLERFSVIYKCDVNQMY